jgi:predicted AAA+ superfamily ATPase
MGASPRKGIRSPARQSNREFLDLLRQEMTATRKINRELLNHLRDQGPITKEILELMRLVRQDLSNTRAPAHCAKCGAALVG